jgi:MoaA/NifB/PqqE/SkfB family radical SAM enzyme
MNNLKTIISWNLNDYCKSECSYCPISLRGGELPSETSEYLRIANLLIESYLKKQGRQIEWIFSGGEPLDMNDIAMFLKLCRANSSSVTLHTNGGRLWLDWWAIEPYVDNLHLTFHYWQNPALIKYISDTFHSKGKKINITSPIRYDSVQQDLDRVIELEETLGFLITKTILYKEADPSAGMFNYKNEDLKKIDFFNKSKDQRERMLQEKTPKKVKILEEKIYFEETTWDQRYEDTYSNGPVYTGQLCNAGVEYLNIGHKGWVSGSNCNNQPLGNIWHPGWMPPQGPQVCTMISCVNESDQRITKFPLTSSA